MSPSFVASFSSCSGLDLVVYDFAKWEGAEIVCLEITRGIDEAVCGNEYRTLGNLATTTLSDAFRAQDTVVSRENPRIWRGII